MTQPPHRPASAGDRRPGLFIGIGTVVNVATVLIGSLLGVLIGHRLSHRTRDLVTDALGLVTLLIAITSALTVGDAALSTAVGKSAPVLIVLGAMLIGGITGSLLRIEQRLEGAGAWMQHRPIACRERAHCRWRRQHQ